MLKTTATGRGGDIGHPRRFQTWGCRLILAAGVLFGAVASTFAQGAAATVTTIAGSPSGTTTNSYAGYRDGMTIGQVVNGVGDVAQFNQPVAVASDPSSTKLFIADMANEALRMLDREQKKVATVAIFAAGTSPIDVAVDASTNVYLLTQGDGMIRRYDKHTNFLGAANLGALTAPTAMALDASGDIYVVESGGALKKVKASDGSVSTITVTGGTLLSPQGITVLDNGALVIADTGNHVIRYLTSAGAITNTVGTIGTTNRTLGGATVATFSYPTRVAKAGNNIAVVADSQNHRVVTVAPDGEVSLLYGIDAAKWMEFESLYPEFSFELHPGWEDGAGDVASSRVPSGLAVLGDGVVVSTELYYNILRETAGTGLTGPAGVSSGDGESALPNPPSISFAPTSGYYPMGVDITVTSSSTNVFYRTDGQDVSTNDTRVAMTGGVGTIRWFEPLSDLTALRIGAFLFSGTNVVSTNVAGIKSTVNQIGVTSDIQAGVGATAVVPLVVNLNTNNSLRSLQFRVSVKPDPGNAVPLLGVPAGGFNFVTTGTNDFIQVAGPVKMDGQTVSYIVNESADAGTAARLLSVSALGQTDFNVESFAAVAVLSIKIPNTAVVGDKFIVSVTNPSGTSDGLQDDVTLSAMADRTITVANNSYVVGDTSPGRWYNAGDFGNGDLLNSDVNNAFLASLGVRVPYTFSDVFNAMDAYPDESAGGSPEGDGVITIADWALISKRSLREDGNNFIRAWSTGGIHTNGTTTLPNLPATGLATAAPGDIWSTSVQISAGSVDNANPGDVVNLPVTVSVNDGVSVEALGFRVQLVAEGQGGALPAGIVWTPAALDPGRTLTLSPHDFGKGWANLSLAGKTTIGSVSFKIPDGAVAGTTYRVRFAFASVLSNEMISLVESFAGRVRVLEALADEPEVSDEWLTRFFNSVDRALVSANLDTDGDGISNLKEFLAGTDPTNIRSRLEFIGSKLATPDPAGNLRLEWITAPGKTYVVECAENPATGPWTVIGTVTGDGEAKEVLAENSGDQRFYRIRLQP